MSAPSDKRDNRSSESPLFSFIFMITRVITSDPDDMFSPFQCEQPGLLVAHARNSGTGRQGLWLLSGPHAGRESNTGSLPLLLIIRCGWKKLSSGESIPGILSSHREYVVRASRPPSQDTHCSLEARAPDNQAYFSLTWAWPGLNSTMTRFREATKAR
ncbi:hypothetical protein ElyMa_003529100 [Elysia marginata]|uniref:Uncharacterized protein n=1 Tax=Elysia marginata TaxID=1093978 RepID=A0AAV4EH49_9GAST|nr:hypothetical protein ElyMa_003529100 [Elysia marginata]